MMHQTERGDVIIPPFLFYEHRRLNCALIQGFFKNGVSLRRVPRSSRDDEAISPLPFAKGRAWGGVGDCFPLVEFTLSAFATLSVNSANVLGVATLAPHAHLPWRERKCQGVQVSARECRCDTEPTLQKPWP